MTSLKRKKQSSTSCQLCHRTSDLRWQCDGCQILFCEQCKTSIHFRLKSARKHYIVKIQDVGKKMKVVCTETEDVSGMFASLEVSQCQDVNTKVINSVVNSYMTDLEAVHKLICTDDEKVFYLNSNKKIVEGKLLNSSIKVVRVYNEEVFDLTMNSKNELVTARFDCISELKVLTAKNELKTVRDFIPLKVLGMHYNKYWNELFIGVRDSGPKYSVNRNSERSVIVCGGQHYRRKRTIEFNSEGHRLFTYPARINTDDNSTIYVIDSINDEWHGRIVAVSMIGVLKFTYSGYEYFNKSNSAFSPLDIAVSQSKNLVVLDGDNHVLHILRTDGQLIGLQNTQDVGIDLPGCLSFNSKGFLLIGCNTYEDEPEKANICVVKLSV